MTLLKPYYAFAVTLGLLLAICFPVTSGFAKSAKRDYYRLQAITIIGAVLGAKLSVLVGDLHWPWHHIDDWMVILSSGRSITGALIGGFVFAELAKPMLGYLLPPNDRFAAILPFSIAIGRIGCAVTGCCAGIPYNGWCAMRDAHDVARFPSQLLEAAFQLVTGIAFIFMARRRILFGRLFSLYLVLYGIFRFASENLRDTPKDFFGWSAYQWFSILMALLGLGFLVKRTFWLPESWKREKTLSSSEQVYA